MVVPAAVNLQRKSTHLWGTAGVRLARLTVTFDHRFAPSIRPAGSDGAWQPFDGDLRPTTYLIPVDEFISVEIPRLGCPTREQFRRLCDQVKTTQDLQDLLRRQ